MIQLKRFVLAVLVAAPWMTGGVPAEAQQGEPVGEVLRQEGSVLILRAGATGVATVGDAVYVSDRIVTNPQARVAVQLADGTVLSIGSDSDIRIDRFVAGTEDRPRIGTVTMLFGAIRAAIAPGGPSQFEVRSRAAIASARSTDFACEATAASMAVFVVEGTVDVSSTAGADRLGDAEATVTLGPGDGSTVEIGQPPPQPSQWSSTRAEALLRRTDVR